MAQKMAVQKLTTPAKTKFFGHADEKCRESLWPVSVFLICGHKKRCDFLTGFHKDLTTTKTHPTSRVTLGQATQIPTEDGEPTSVRPLSSTTQQSQQPKTAVRASKPKMLDLFCGTKSVSNVYRKLGFEVVTVDWDPKWEADYQVDVATWDYKQYLKPGEFHTVVCTPPCTEFSRALTTRPRDLDKGNRLVQRALKIVRYL